MGCYALQTQANPRERRPQLMRTIGQQQPVRLHERLNTLSRRVEASGQRGDLIMPGHTHTRREISATKLFDASLQSRKPAGKSSSNRIRTQSERKDHGDWKDEHAKARRVRRML